MRSALLGALAASALTLLCVEPAHATNWIGLGNGWYMDGDSVSRSGDIATLVVREAGERAVIEFDCQRAMVIGADGRPPKDGPFHIEEEALLRPAFDHACKKWYQLWK